MIDAKITITATLVDHDLAELQKKLEACVMDFLGDHINPIAERTPDGEPDTWSDVTIKEIWTIDPPEIDRALKIRHQINYES